MFDWGVHTTKDDLRAEARARRRNVTDPVGSGALMATHVMDVLERCECVAVYLSYGQEPSTEPLIELLRANGIVVLVPRVVGEELELCELADDTVFEVHGLGMREPTGPVSESLPDAVIMPALAVDLAGHRLGKGKGYFDRYLASTPNSVLRIVFVYDDDVIDDVPSEPHDEPVNIIVTERRLIASS